MSDVSDALAKMIKAETLIRLGASSVHKVLDFNFTPPERDEQTKGRLITLLFTKETLPTVEGLITLRQLYRAHNDGHFKKPGHYHFVVDKKPFRKATYELTMSKC